MGRRKNIKGREGGAEQITEGCDTGSWYGIIQIRFLLSVKKFKGKNIKFLEESEVIPPRNKARNTLQSHKQQATRGRFLWNMVWNDYSLARHRFL